MGQHITDVFAMQKQDKLHCQNVVWEWENSTVYHTPHPHVPYQQSENKHSLISRIIHLLLRARHYAYTPQTDSANTTQTPLGPTELADISTSGRQLYVASSEVIDPREPMEMF